MEKEFWQDDAPAEASVPAESGGDFWLSDKPAAQQDLPSGVTPSTAGAGRGNAGLSDYRAKAEAQTAAPARAAWEDHADQLMADTAAPAAKKVSVLEGVQLQPEKPWSFREASEARRAIDDMPVRRGESIATPVPTAAGIGMDIRDSIKNPAARGVVAGFIGLGQVLPGAVEAAADFVGADGVADVAARTARTGRQIAAPLQPKAGNDKLVFDIANSITQTAPTIIMGLGGGPAMTALFGQSAAQEYSQGRSAGLDGGTAAARAGVMAGAEVLGERFGFGEQIKILKGLTARIPAKELAPIFARQIMKEIPGEQLTTLVQFLGDKYGPGAQNPEAALSDYLQQAGDTLKVTIGQTAVMGGGPVAISEARKQFARPVDRTPQIEALRKTGDETAAALLERRQNTEMAAFTTERETEALADFGSDLQQRYRDTRLAGAKTGDAVVQTAARWNFEQAAQLAGLSPKAQEAISNKLAEVPAEKAAGFVQKAITGLVNAGQAQSFDGLDNLAQTIETQRDQMLDSVLATMANIETLEQQDAPQEAAVDTAAAEAQGLGGAGVDGVDQPGAVPALSDINDVMVTPELDAVHAAATSPLNDLPEPTDAQKKAGNYKVGKIRMSGLDISIENPQGSERRGVDPDGNQWTTPMRDHYGYFKGTTAADGDKLDVFIKPGTPQDYAGPVFVVDQVDPKTGKFDEHKVVFGAADQAEAEAIYRRNYSADWNGLANITALPMPAFKAWASSKETRKPLGAITEQVNVQNAAPGTEAQAAAAPVEAPAPARINAAAAGLPAAPGAGDVQADGVTLKDGARITLSEQPAPEAFSSLVRGEFGNPKTLIATNDAGEEVGRLTFMPNGGPIDSFVREQDRRRGVGTALYDALEARGGKLPPVESGVAISDDARAFRADRSKASQTELLGQNSQPLSEGGKPFKTELAARKEKKLHPDKRVVKSPDGKGFILKPMSAKQIAAQEAAARRIRGADTGDKGPLSAHGFILARGGLAKSSMADAGFDKNVRIGNRWLFTDSGKTLAQAGQDLKEAGFITEETENAASDIIRRSIASPQYTSEGWESVAEAEAQTRFEDHLKAQQESDEDPFASLADDGYTTEDTEGTGFDQASPEIQAEVAALSAQLEAMGEDSETILERVALQYPDATQQEYHEHVKAAITAAVAEAAQPAGRGDPGQDDGEQGQAREGTGESLTDRPDGTLSVRGDTKALRERLTAAGIPAKSILPSVTGVVVGRTQAQKARDLLDPAEQTAYSPTIQDTKTRRSLALQELGDDWTAENGIEGAKDLFKRIAKLQDGGRLEMSIMPQRTTDGNFYVGSYQKGGIRKGAGSNDSSAKTLAEAKAIADAMLQKQVDYLTLGDRRKERRERLTGQDRWQYGTPLKGQPENQTKAMRQVVDYMNGDITRTALLDHLEKSGLQEGVMFSITQRLEDDAPNFGEMDAMLKRREDAALKSPTRADIEAQQARAEQADKLDERAQVKRESEAGADSFTLTVEDGRDGGTQPMFSRTSDPLAILSETDDLYSMPKSDKDTIEGITADHDSEIKVRKTDLPGNETMYTLTMPDGTPARITVRKSGPRSVYGAEVDADNNTTWETGRPGENPEDVPDDMEDVWIDVSNLKPGQNGARVYNIAATFAHNTGRMFIGDPAGLSDEAMRRRAEHMLSSALKFGTTRHLAPHPRQTDGATGLGIPALKWVYGDDVGNIQRLAELNVKALDSVFPEASAITYDPATGTFSTELAERLNPSDVRDLFSRGTLADRQGSGRRAARAGAGWRTLARGAVFRSLLRGRGTGGDGAGRSGAGESLLDQLVRQRAQLASATKDGRIFYSRPLTAELFRQMTTPMQRGMKTADLQKAIAPVLNRWENGPNVTVVATTKDLPMPAPGDVHGVYFGGKVYLVAQNIRDKAKAMEVLTHEAIAHHGLREMLGKDDWKKFMGNIQLALKTGNKPLAAIRKDVRAAYVDDAGKFNLSEMQESDEIAAKVVEQAVDADGNFRPGFGFVKSVYAKVVEFLRSIGIDVKMTMAELQGALVNAQRFLEAGNRAAGAKKTAKPVFARAYHGTPHRFERFTTDAIGTGEGAQAYGWGLYFASKKEIAEHYRKGLSYKQIVKEFRDEMPDDAGFDEALDAADTMSPQRARVIRALAADDWLGFDYPAQAITAAFKELDAYDASQELQDAVKGAQGQLYEVEIPEDSEILLWDKPLSEQPKKVLDALKQLAVDGADYYPTLAGMMQPMEAGNTTGRAVYMAMQRESGSDKNASRELRSAGIRGIKYLDGTSRDKGDGSFNYVVFSGDDVSIVEAAYSRAAKAPASIEAEKAAGAAKPAQAEMFQPGFWDAPQETRLDRVIYELQDGRIDLKRVQEAITKANTIPEKFDARLQETLYPGRVATRAKQFLDDEAKPLLDAMARNNVTMGELADYLHARHAEERNKQIAKVNPDLPDGGAGKNSKGVLMTTEAAKQHIAGLSEGKRMVLTAMAKRVDAITQGTTKLLVDEGLEKQETIDAWTGAYKSYVPLFRDEAENGNPHPTGSGMSVRGGSSKRAVGSTKQATNILAHVLMQREAAITRAEKNRVAVALYGLALTNPNPEFWTTIKPGMSPEAIGRELQRMGVDPTVAEAGMMGVPTIKTVDPTLGRVVSRPNPMYKSLPGAIVLKVNGEDRVLMVNVNDPRGLRMAENLKNMDGLTKFDIAGSIVGKTTRWLASVNTQYNPAFGLVNLTRDTLGGAINLSSTKLRGKTLKVLAMTPGALKGIGLELSGKKSGEWGRLFRQFQQDGGQTGYREMFKDANDRAKALEAELKAMEKAGKLTTDKVAGKVLGALDIFNTTLENAVRLAAYREALQEGMSRPEAARLGRELTVDFNRKGRMGRELGPLYAFFNASVQGSARTLQTLAGPDGAKIIAGGVSLGVLQAVMLLAAGYDDDEIPEFVKSRALIIPLGTDDEGKKRYFTIPLPLGLHVLPNTGRVLAELTMDGGKDALTKGFEAAGEIAGAFNPLGGGSMIKFDQNGQIEVVNSVLKNLSPTVTDWALELTWNQNFAGAAIEREGYGNDPRPGFERAREGTLRAPTGQAYLEISRILNKVSGGDEYEAGRVSPTPEMVRYLAQVVGGGLLREIEKTVNTSIAMSKGEDAKPTGLPVFGRFYGEVDDASVQRSRYYDNLTAIEKAEKLIRAAEKKGDLDAADRIEADKPEAMLKKEKNRAVKDLRELNKEAMETVGDSEAIKALDEERTAVMRDLNEAAAEIDAPRRDATLGAKLRKSMAAAP